MAMTHAGARPPLAAPSPTRTVGVDVLDALDASVRSRVRAEGVDPQRDPGAVRRIAEQLVAAHDQHSLTGAVAPVPDAAAAVTELMARVSGFGPLQPFLDDPAVEEVWINDPSRVFIARHGRHELTNVMLTRAQVDELVERMLKSSGRRGTSRLRPRTIAIGVRAASRLRPWAYLVARAALACPEPCARPV